MSSRSTSTTPTPSGHLARIAVLVVIASTVTGRNTTRRV